MAFDSSVGRAWDCNGNTAIPRSLVRPRFEGIFACWIAAVSSAVTHYNMSLVILAADSVVFVILLHFLLPLHQKNKYP
jgi:hypothetical protein